jgi:hypothetical protein
VLGTLVETVVNSVVVPAINDVLDRWRLRARKQGELARRETFEVPAKIRLRRGGWEGRWREGFVRRTPAGLMFRPRRPRPGPRLDLDGIVVTGQRSARPLELSWFAGPTVLLTKGPLGPVEIAFGSDEYMDMAVRLLRNA